MNIQIVNKTNLLILLYTIKGKALYGLVSDVISKVLYEKSLYTIINIQLLVSKPRDIINKTLYKKLLYAIIGI